MILTSKQEQGIKIAVKRYRDNEPYTCIAGYAGTGKSTLVSYIVNELQLDNNEVEYCCYTGKAALILSQKGCPAITAHRLIYKSIELEDGSYLNIVRDYPENQNLKLVVVDEVSMLEKEMWDILMSWKIHVIALGDPEQLPPLHESNHILDHPHIFLDEIMRQQKDNSIIDLSMNVREGKFINYQKTNNVIVMPKSNLTEELLLSVDQVICGKNNTRHDLNTIMRQGIHGNKYNDLPLDKDKIICLKNYCEFDLINGEIGLIVNPKVGSNKLVGPYIKGGFVTEYSYHDKLKMDYKTFTEGVSGITPEIRCKLHKCKRPLEFDFAYAITCHKSQGSQWDSIMVFDEWLGDKEMHRRWLYTAVTRAINNLIIVK